LSAEKDFAAIEDGRVDVAFMGGGLEIEVRVAQNGVDVLFPETSTLRMSL
jgi:hypothetical protein